MKTSFSKYWIPILVVLIICILGFVIWVEIFRLKGFWLAQYIFNFLNAWAIILYATVTLLLAIFAFWGIRENHRERLEDRRRQTLERIREWAEEVIEVLGRPFSKETWEENLNDLDIWLQPSRGRSISVLKDAELLGVELFSPIRKAFTIFFKFTARLLSGKKPEELIAEMAKLLEIEEKIEPISNEKELVEAKIELMAALQEVIFSTSKRLTPLI